MKARRYYERKLEDGTVVLLVRPGLWELIEANKLASHAKATRFYKAIEALITAGEFTTNEVAFLAANDRYFLLRNILRRPDIDHPWLYERCREVEADPDGFLDLWARFHYKSTIITFGGAFQEIIDNPNITIGIFSITKDVSQPFLQQIKDECEQNELLPRLYPDVFWERPRHESPLWSADKGIVLKRSENPKEATVERHGLLDGSWTGRHFGLRIYDDTINEKVVTTPEMVAKATMKWELSQNLGTLDSHRRWHPGTRYSFADTYGELISRGVLVPRIYPATDDGSLNGRPVLLSQKRWEEIKVEQRGVVAAQMLQNPLAGNENTFRPEWLRPYWLRPRILNVYITIDPSKGRTRTSDRTAMAVIGVDANYNRYLIDGYCHRMSLTERWTNLKNLWRKWSRAKGIAGVWIGCEQYGLMTDIEYFNTRILAEDLQHFPEIVELNWARESVTQSKKDRVERLEPYFRNSAFWMPPKVWVPIQGVSTWSITETGEIAFEPYDAPWREEVQATLDGESWRIMEPIKRLDADNQPYDLVRVFFDEFRFFPFSPRNDLIDATSRIEDMEPFPPAKIDLVSLRPMEAVDA